jgi:hypothetical protein
MKHIQKLFGAYHRPMYAHPIFNQAVQSSILMGIGDIISQAIFEGKEIKNIDKGRVIRFAGIGLIFMVSVEVLSILCQGFE